MAFTPLVSPAVTPLNHHFGVETAFAVPASYFSPLTSPALRAQHDSSSAYDQSAHFNGLPVEMGLEPPVASAVAAGQDLSKKARRNNAAKAQGKASIKSSPIAKPQRRRTGPSPAVVAQALTDVEGRSLWAADQPLLPMAATSAEGADNSASVSPENLTDMPPPPVPNRRSSTGNSSPHVHALDRSARQQQPGPPHPATPASLMKLPASKIKSAKRPPPSSPEQSTVTGMIESLQLPEAPNKAPPSPGLGAGPSSAIKAGQPLSSPGV